MPSKSFQAVACNKRIKFVESLPKRTFFFNSVIHTQSIFTIPSLVKITYIQSWNICQVAIYSHFYKNQGPLDEHSTKIYILLILKCTKISPFKWDYSQRFETRQISSFSMHTLNRNPNLSMLKNQRRSSMTPAKQNYSIEYPKQKNDSNDIQ